MNPQAHPHSTYGRFFQLGYVTRDIHQGCADLRGRMGAVQSDLILDVRGEDGAPTMLKNLAHLVLPGVEIELIEPRFDMDSIYLDTLPPGPGVALHHLGFQIPNEAAWHAAMLDIAAAGTPVVAQFMTSRVWVAYFDTRAQSGHFSEIVYRLTASGERHWPSAAN